MAKAQEFVGGDRTTVGWFECEFYVRYRPDYTEEQLKESGWGDNDGWVVIPKEDFDCRDDDERWGVWEALT